MDQHFYLKTNLVWIINEWVAVQSVKIKLKSIQHCSKLIETEYFQDIGTDNNQSGYIIVALIWMITFSIE